MCAGDEGGKKFSVLCAPGDAADIITVGGEWYTACTWWEGLEFTEVVLLGALEGPLEVTTGALKVWKEFEDVPGGGAEGTGTPVALC